MHDHSNCNDCHDDDISHENYDIENLQPLQVMQAMKMENKKSNDKNSPFIIKWGFVLIVYFLFFSASYYNFTVLNKVYENEADKNFVVYFNIFILILIPICQWKTILNKARQTDLDHVIKIMQLKKSICSIEMKNFRKDCVVCKKPKFERSSHCSSCQFCVLRRDHHCVWTASCIGYQNTQTFINYCLWSMLGSYSYFCNYIEYYNNYGSLVYKDKNLELSLFHELFMGGLAMAHLFSSLGCCVLLFSQIISLISEASFYEKQKDPEIENHYMLITSNNNKKNHNPYNKGFIVNFYEIIGPTLFHFIFPLSKFQKEGNKLSNNCSN